MSKIDPGAPLCELWSTSRIPRTWHIWDIAPAAMWSASPEYDHLATDFTCEIHDRGNENPIGLLWGLTVCPRAPCQLLQHVGKISAAFLWPTRHRVVSAIYGAPIIYNWKQAADTAISGGGTSIWGTFYVQTSRLVWRGVKPWGPATRFSLKWGPHTIGLTR